MTKENKTVLGSYFEPKIYGCPILKIHFFTFVSNTGEDGVKEHVKPFKIGKDNEMKI